MGGRLCPAEATRRAPITDLNILQRTLKELRKMTPRHHTGNYVTRYIQMLYAASFSNPISTIQDRLPPRADTGDTLLSTQVTGTSPIKYHGTRTTHLVKRKSLSKKARGKAPRRNKTDDAASWPYLIEAQQHAYHPMLVQLKLAHRGLMKSMRQKDVDDAIPDEIDDQALKQVAEWRRQLEQGDNSLSRRVEAILDTMQQHLDLHLHDSFILVDESVWFFDIVAIALKKTYHSVTHDTYKGRLDTVQRHLTIKKVAQAMPPHSILASRGTGGQGLSMQFAKVVIRCGP